ncbi:MAG TPA: gfo/Idh/MocA family oxidoreductase, partial [Candidatus Hydrogenedentes bacterium]|nr:gfo/Idh/MocA family oxidoreductase [Candidatus Hydrogenedentota bacterium]
MTMSETSRQTHHTRRDFMKTAAAGSMAALLPGTYHAHAAGSDTIRVGLVGCGRRGTGAARDCLSSSAGIEIRALGDVFEDQLKSGRKGLAKLAENIPDDACFTGFDAYKKVLACDIDLVILAAPPGFRPEHLAAAVEAGKHVFMEKPAGVDPAGIRSVLESAERAKDKGLALVAGTQRRHQADYVATLERIHGGAIGAITAAQCYWVGDYGYYPAVPRKEGWSDMEWQLRNWNYFTWLSGDHIVEQHVHNIDVINWALDAHPVAALGMGGRQQRTGAEYGHIYDHFAIDFEYPGGVHVASYCRQMAGTANEVSERLIGTKGTCNPRGTIEGETPFT